MQIELDELAAREGLIYLRLQGQKGHFEQLGSRLLDDGTYDEYAGILAGYAELLDVPEASVEALKRAVFLVWFSQSEPRQLSGLGRWPDDLAQRVLLRLEEAARANMIDPEFAVMLGIYAEILDYPLTMVGPAPAVSAFIATVDMAGWWKPPIQVNVPTNPWTRGLMGKYWEHMAGLSDD